MCVDFLDCLKRERDTAEKRQSGVPAPYRFYVHAPLVEIIKKSDLFTRTVNPSLFLEHFSYTYYNLVTV